MKKTAPYFTAFALLALLTAGNAKTYARSDHATAAARHKAVSTILSDAEFEKNAAEGGIAEVKFGQLAEDKGSSQEVKDFAKLMVTDHTKANEQLQKDAEKEKVSLPNTMSKKDQETYDRLSKLSGKTFDRAYARDMVRDHKADIVEFRNESKQGKQEWAKEFATQTLPTLEDHLKQAEKVLHSVQPAGNSH